MKKFIPMIVALTLSVVFSVSSAENIKRGLGRKKSRNEKVKMALSKFVHGMQYELPGVVGSVYRVGTSTKDTNKDNELLAQGERISNFMGEFSGVEGNHLTLLPQTSEKESKVVI